MSLLGKHNQIVPICPPAILRQTLKMMSTDTEKYDLVVFGATGFTGQYVVEEVAKAARKEKGFPHITWAIAGRNESKLKESLDSARKETGLDLNGVGLLVADITDVSSIDNMTKQARIVLNCVGPFHKYGRPVVESCIRNGASQVDITGEPTYVDQLKLDLDKVAETAGVHIVNCCGVDSVPADVGLCHLTKKFPGRLNSAKGFIHATGKISTVHTGTMESLSYAFSTLSQAQAVYNKLYPTKLPKPHYSAGRYYRFHKNTDISLWGMPFPSDEGMVDRSQRYLSEKTDHPFVQYQGFMGSKSLFPIVGISLGVGYLYCLSFFSCSRNFLFKHPSGMTFGAFSKEGPTREELLKYGFGFTIVGEGWKETLPNKADKYPNPPNHKMVLDIFGPDPAYRGTSIMLVACAMTLLREKEDCAEKGGVMSPGMTFMNTNIVDRLADSGISFNVREID